MARSPSPSSAQRRRLSSAVRGRAASVTPFRPMGAAASTANAASLAPSRPPIPTLGAICSAVKVGLDEKESEKALTTMLRAKHDIDHLDTHMEQIEADKIVFGEQLRVLGPKYDKLKAECDQMEADLTKAKMGFKACETEFAVYHEARLNAIVEHDEAERKYYRLNPATKSLPTYSELGCDSTEAVRELEGLTTSSDILMLTHRELTTVLRSFRDKKLPLVPDFVFGDPDHVIKIKGGKEALQERVALYLRIELDDSVGDLE